MQLHQLLRIITSNTFIVLFNMSGEIILRVKTKKDIPVDLYEYDIFLISCGQYVENTLQNSLYIMLQK